MSAQETDNPHWAIITPNISGGPFAKRAATLTKALEARGASVDVLYLQHHGQPDEGTNHTSTYPLTGRARSSVIQIAKYLRHAHPDVVLSLGFMMNVPCLLAVHVARYRGTLLVNEGTLPTTGIADYPRGVSPLVAKLIYNGIYSRADSIVCTSAAVRSAIDEILIRDRLKSKLTIIPNPVEIDKSAGSQDSLLLIESADEPVFVSVGRLVPLKRIDVALAAFSQFVEHNGVGHLVIAGTGPEEQSLKRTTNALGLHDRVHFLGFVSPIEKLLTESTILIHLASSEGFGNVVAEALASGTPVIVAKGSGGPEELVNGGGLSVDPNRESVLRAMEDIWSDKERLESMRLAALDGARELTPLSVVDLWIRLVRSLDFQP